MKFYPDDPAKIEKLPYASFKRAFSFAVQKMYFIGGRDYGKTYSTKKLIFTNFVKYGKKFAWIRTSDKALSLIQNDEQFFGRQNYLKDIGVETHKVVGNRIYINDKIAGYFFSVNTAHNVKGGEYQLDCIIWDEFMKFGNEHAVKGKRKLFFDLCESIGRGDATRIFLLSNSTNKYDEVLAPFKLDLSKGFGCYLYRDQNSVIHYMAPSKAYQERVKKNLSISGMTEDEQKMAVSNEFSDFGDYGNIRKAKYMYTLQVDDNSFISLYSGEGKIYIRQGVHPVEIQQRIYTTIPMYVNSTVQKIPFSSKKFLIMCHDFGKIIYQNGYCRNTFQSLLTN